MKSRILFTCNSRISAEEIKFFQLLNTKLRMAGMEFTFLSPNAYPGMEQFSLWRRDWGRKDRCFRLGELPIREAMGLIDIEKWQLRVGYFRGHPSGRVDCLPLLEQLAGESLELINRLQPGMIIAWNSLYPFPGIMYDIAKASGIPVVDSERGMVPGTLQLDANLHGLHNSACDLSWESIKSNASLPHLHDVGESFLKEAYLGDFCRYDVSEVGPPEISAQSQRAHKRPRVLVAGAFDHACGISLSDPARKEILPGFESGFDIAKHVAIWNNGLTVFKPHPAMAGSAKLYDARGVSDLLVLTGHPRQFLDWADIVVSYGSLEYDALAFGKPIVLVGRSSLFGKGIGYESLTTENLGAALNQALLNEKQELHQKRFKTLLGYLLENHLFRFDSENCREQSATRWCALISTVTSQTEFETDFSSIRTDIQFAPAKIKRASQILNKVSPPAWRKARRIWNAIKS